MTATAQIVTQEIPGALAVPNAALRYEPPRTNDAQSFNITRIFMPRMPRFERSASKAGANGERTLWILDSGTPRQVTVKTGVTDGIYTEILSGDIAAGAEVITSSRAAAK